MQRNQSRYGKLIDRWECGKIGHALFSALNLKQNIQHIMISVALSIKPLMHVLSLLAQHHDIKSENEGSLHRSTESKSREKGVKNCRNTVSVALI